jgi:hypothetical protein
MTKLPAWFWIFVPTFAVAGIIFITVNFMVNAFFTPVSELPPIYWITLGIVVIVFALFVAIIFRWQRSLPQGSQAGLWAATIGNTFASAMMFSILLLYILTGSKWGGMMVFVAALGTFLLSMAGIAAARLDQARRNG